MSLNMIGKFPTTELPGSSPAPQGKPRQAAKGECLRQGFYSCTNIMTKKHVGEERVYLAYTFHIAVHHQRKPGLELTQGRKQELMQRPWRDVTYRLGFPWLAQLAFL